MGSTPFNTKYLAWYIPATHEDGWDTDDKVNGMLKDIDALFGRSFLISADNEDDEKEVLGVNAAFFNIGSTVDFSEIGNYSGLMFGVPGEESSPTLVIGKNSSDYSNVGLFFTGVHGLDLKDSDDRSEILAGRYDNDVDQFYMHALEARCRAAWGPAFQHNVPFFSARLVNLPDPDYPGQTERVVSVNIGWGNFQWYENLNNPLVNALDEGLWDVEYTVWSKSGAWMYFSTVPADGGPPMPAVRLRGAITLMDFSQTIGWAEANGHAGMLFYDEAAQDIALYSPALAGIRYLADAFTEGGGLTNPMTEDLDMDGFDVLHVGAIQYGSASIRETYEEGTGITTQCTSTLADPRIYKVSEFSEFFTGEAFSLVYNGTVYNTHPQEVQGYASICVYLSRIQQGNLVLLIAADESILLNFEGLGGDPDGYFNGSEPLDGLLVTIPGQNNSYITGVVSSLYTQEYVNAFTNMGATVDYVLPSLFTVSNGVYTFSEAALGQTSVYQVLQSANRRIRGALSVLSMDNENIGSTLRHDGTDTVLETYGESPLNFKILGSFSFTAEDGSQVSLDVIDAPLGTVKLRVTKTSEQGSEVYISAAMSEEQQ